MGNEHFVEGSPDSSTIICTFWTLAQPVAQKFDPKTFAICANQYSYDALNTIVRAIWMNPHWRHLVLMGADLTHAGDIWTAFFKEGMEENGKVKGTTFAFQPEIPRDALETIRKNVILHDLRGKPLDDIAAEINTFENLPAFAEPKAFPEPKPAAFQVFPSEKQGFLIRAPTISRGWLKVLDLIMKFGEEKPTEYGARQKELLNIFCVIEGDDPGVPEFLPFTQKDVDNYRDKTLTGKKTEGVVYTYGSRLHAWPGSTEFNQVENAIEHLKRTPYTRRAIGLTWHVEKDMRDKNPPCLVSVVWSISHGKLEQTCYVRSHDMFEGWPLNLFSWRELQQKVAKEVGIPAGSLMVLSTSAHIYEGKWDEAKKILAKNYTSSEYRFDVDPRGNFVIQSDSKTKKISLQHFTPVGERTQFTWENTHTDEKKALEELFAKLTHSNMISRTDHAFYLGAELQKVFEAMKNGKEYKQDRPLE